jgi:thiamine pyrophosphokinase
MKRAFIFANGRMDEPPAILQSIHPDDLIVAADGGAHHCLRLGIKPHIIIGDFDSLGPQEVSQFSQAGIEIIQYPSHKDETDLELALKLVEKREVDEVYIVGALGARWDMTIANILLIAQPKFSRFRIRLIEGKEDFLLIVGKDEVDLQLQTGDALSLIPLAGDAQGITTYGLEYPLKDENLYFGSPRGVSNVCLQDNVRIELKKGLLLCIYRSVNH